MVARLLLASVSLAAATKMCPSPSGFHPCDCIIEVESGSRAEEVAAEDGSDDGVGISADLDKAAAAVVWRRQLLLGQQRE